MKGSKFRVNLLYSHYLERAMSFLDQLKEKRIASEQRLPKDTFISMQEAIASLKSSSIEKLAPKVGEKLPSFVLPNQLQEMITLESLLAHGPVIITFYRGNWCPYCNLELQAYQYHLEKIKALGVSLVAIGPELPDESLTTIEKNELQFQVLSDVNCDYAKELGIAFPLADKLRPIYAEFGIDLEQKNGSFELPVSATFVVDQDGMILESTVDVDHTIRQDPLAIISLLQSHQSQPA